MPSPSGIFTIFTVEELAEIRASALAGVTEGFWTSISGGAKSGSKQRMDVATMLAEYKYAMQALGALPQRVSKTYGDFVNPPYPATQNEQV